ncbi:hypothetical protein K474DRAFT_1611711 [Panus rudis PR-1116 ss-1]|nr:hypothetical protein K474DRAFT_1611711 [Panus rudis PR-1116 ss-1]
MVSAILDPSALISSLPQLLPASKKKLETPQDGLAALVHTALSKLGFRLIAVDDAGPARSFDNNVLPQEWNSLGPGSYTFRYRHEQSSLEFIVKVSKLGSRTLVHAIATESERAASLDISTNDFTSPSFYPHDVSGANAAPLVHGFISSNRVADFISQLQLTIIQKIMPGLRKEGYTESSENNSGASGSRPPNPASQPRPQPVSPPYAPRNDPLQVTPPFVPPVGRSDLDPFPRNPFAPPSLFPGNDGDGMFVGPSHPIFGGSRPGQGGIGGRGPWGGDGFLPPMGAPPGARFDPVGPGLGPHPGGPIPGVPRPGAGRGVPGSGNMNDPDNDEFMPPGARDMFM